MTRAATLPVDDELPQTLAECHELIRELRAMDEEPLRQTGAIIGVRLGVPPQAGALLMVLANSPRPLSASQIEVRLPRVRDNEFRSVKTIYVFVFHIRRALGREAVMSNGRHAGPNPRGYWLSPEMRKRVLKAAK